MVNFDNDVTIHKSEMSREMEGEAVALVRHAMSIQQTDKDVVQYVVTEMNEKQPDSGTWKCFVGKSLLAMSLGQRLNVDHIEGTYLYFNLGGGGGGGKQDVLLYKSFLM